MSIVVAVSIGIALLLSFGFVRIIYGIPLNKVLTGLYGIVFILALFTSPEFMAISFDASGATTGALTVPFILALAVGVTAMKKDSKAAEKDSFGLVAIVSAGAIISVMLMSIVSKTDKMSGSLEVGLSGSDKILVLFCPSCRQWLLKYSWRFCRFLYFFCFFRGLRLKLPKHQK